MVITDTSPARPGPIDAPALFGLLILVLVCVSRAVLSDGDTFTHIAAGEWMLDHRAVLTWDPFSATFGGQAWDAHEWLAEVLFGAAHRVAGLTGVVLLSAAAAGMAFANLARHVGRWCGWAATMSLTTAAVICVMPSLLARPHLLALPVLELWIAGLLGARAAGRGPAWWMLGLMVVWANLHGGFAFGIALALAFAVEASLDRAAWRDRTASRWWLFVAGAVAAAVVTPQGVDGVLFPVRLLHLHSLAFIDEWQPVSFSKNFAFEAVVLALVGLLGTGRVRMHWFRLLLLVGLLHLTLAHARHAVLFGLGGALLLAEPVGRGFGGARAGVAVAGRAGRSRLGWGFAGAGVAAALLLRAAVPVGMADSGVSPVSALAQVPVVVSRTPVLNSNQFGGYLALAGLHPFIDGRAELYGDAFVAEYLALSQPGALERGVAKYGIGWALLAADDPLVPGFEGLAGWRRVYADGVAAVFVRDCLGAAAGLGEGMVAGLVGACPGVPGEAGLTDQGAMGRHG